MIIEKGSTVVAPVTMQGKPDENWTGDDDSFYVVDDHSALGQFILQNAPYVELIFENNRVVDAIPKERPPAPPPAPTEIEILELDMYEALAEVYEEQLTVQLDAYEATAAVYEEQVIGQLNTYEAIAEMYELIFAGGEANV